MTDASSSRAAGSGNPPNRSSGSPSQLLEPARLALCEEQDDRLRRQAPGDEREHLCRGAIKPLDVIDDADQRLLVRRVGQQAEHGQPDQKSIGLRARAQTERGRQRVTLWRRQPSETVQQSRAQLMQAGEGKLHLPFHPGRAKDPTVLGAIGSVVQ